MNINVTYDQAQNTLPTGFVAGVNAAVAFYDAIFTDPVSITIDIGYGEVHGQALRANALGETIGSALTTTYANVLAALKADATSTTDATAVASLPTSDPVSGTDTYILSSALAKALNFSGSFPSVDGYVGFSNSQAFDYKRSDGISAGSYDFVGAVEHEISEVLGRVSYSGASVAIGANTYANSHSVLDLFRYKANGSRQLTTGSPSYFSINSGATNLDNFNNPVSGDAGDLGDWAASAGNNSFLDASGSGVINAVTATDIDVMDAIGFNVVLPTIAINPIDGDNRINPAQAQQGVFITGTTTNVENGSTVTVKIVNSSNVVVDTVHASVSSGAWSASLTTAQASALVNGVYTVKADVTNLEGNAAKEATVTLGQTPIDLYFTGGAGSDDWTMNVLDGDSGAIIYTNWTGNAVPTSSDNVEIGPGDPYGTVVIDASAYEHTDDALVVNALVLDSGQVLDQQAGPLTINSLLSVSGQFNDTGSVLVVGGELSTPGNLALISGATLELDGDVVFDGAGSVTLAQSSIAGSNLSAIANIENYGTINGSGSIGGAALIDHNYGVVDANEDDAALSVTPSSMSDALSNSGTLEDTGAAGLAFASTLIVQSSSGVIAANGDDAHVDFNSSTVEGGLLSSTGTGQINFYGNSTLDGSTSAGAITNLGIAVVQDGSILNLVGPLIHNKGSIYVEALSYATQLQIAAGGVTFDGGGAILMNDSGGNFIEGGTLTLANGLLGGAGTVSTNVVVEALGTIGTFVHANNPLFDNTNALTFTGASIINAGFIIDNSVGHIVLDGVTLYQKIGSALGRVDSEFGAVDLENTVIQGGALIGSSSGAVETDGGGSTLDGSSGAGALSNANIVNILDGSNLLAKGTIHNSGVINLEALSYTTTLLIDPTKGLTLDSAGKVTLSDSGGNVITGNSALAKLTNVDNTISGGGGFSDLTIINQASGVIDATGANAQLAMDGTDTLQNHGLIEATGAAGLSLANLTIDSAFGGTIIAANGSQVDLTSDVIKGGLLKTAGTGFWHIEDGYSILDGSTSSGAVSNASLFKLQDSATLTLKGTIHNSGTIELDALSYTTSLIVDKTTGVTLDKAGHITFDDSGGNDFQSFGGVGTLTNVDNVISGSGFFENIAIVNQVGGVIDATGVTSQFAIDGSDTLQNHGLVEATGAAGLSLAHLTIDAALGGTIVAATGSQVDLTSVTLTGGTLSTAGTGFWHLEDGGSILDGSTASGAVSNASLLKLQDSATLTLKGTIHNSGTIELDASSYATTLVIDPTAGATLDKGGKITFDDNGGNNFQSFGGVGTLTNVDDVISGSGYFQNINIVNQAAGVINATGTNAQLAINGSDTLQNHGLVEATGAAGLSLAGLTIDGGLGGTITAANGSHIDLFSDTLEGGNLKTLGTGYWSFDDASTILDGSTASGAVSNAALLKVNDSLSLTLKGTIHNSGTIQVNASSYATSLIIDQTAGATLDKSGKVTLSDSGGNTIQATGGVGTLTNVDDAITGSGLFQNIAIVNQTGGIINATGANAQLEINSTDTLKNQGLIEATGAAGLSLANQIADNTGGTIFAGNGARVQLTSDMISFGTFQTSGTGIIEIVDSGTTLTAQNVAQGLTLSGKIQIDDGQSMFLVGSVVNKGMILVGVNAAATLNSVAALAGSGSVVLFDSATTLLAGSLNNAANTIMGAGTISATIQQQTGGTIEATAVDNALILSSGFAIANAGVLEANGAELMVNDAVAGAGHGLVTGGGELAFASTFDENVTFQGAGALKLSKPTYGGAISGLVTGDMIDLSGLGFAAGAVASVAAGVLTVTSGSASQTLKVTGTAPTGFIVSADGAGGSLVTAAAGATVAQFQANQATLDATPTGFVIVDTAANVAAGLNSLNVDTHIVNITLTDPGVPTLALGAVAVATDTRALGEITNQNLAIAVTDTAANVANRLSALDANAHVASIAITSGTGAFNGSLGVNAASLVVTGASTAVNLSSALNYAGTFSLAAGATMGVSGGGLTLSGNASFAGGLVNGANTLSTSASTTVAGLTIEGGANWSNSKTVTQTGGALKLGDTSATVSSLSNTTTGSYSIGDDSGVSRGAATGSNINNAGLFAKTGGTGVSVIAASFIDTGAVAVSSGTLAFAGVSNSFAGAVSGAGAVQFSAGATTIGSGAKISAAKWSMTGTGTAATLNEGLTYAGGFSLGVATSFSISSGDVLTLTGASALAGALTGAGALTISGGATTIAGSASFSTAKWTISGATTSASFGGNSAFGGALALGAGATVGVATGDTLKLTGTSNISGIVTGAGTLSLAGGSTTFLSGASVGVANLSLQTAGATTISENLNYGGTFTQGTVPTLAISSNDTLALSGSSTINGAVSGAGTLAITGGSATIASSSSLGVAKWAVSGGALTVAKNLAYAGAFTASGGAAFTLSGSSAALKLQGKTTISGVTVNGAGLLNTATATGSATISGLTIGGTVAWSNTRSVIENGGSATLGDSSGGAVTLTNVAGAVYDFTDATSGILLGNTASSVANAGLLEKTAGGGTNAIAANIANTGRISTTSGDLDLQGNLTGTGALAVGGGATLQLDGSVGTGQKLNYATTGGDITLDDLVASGVQLFHGSINGWAAGDMLNVGTAFGAGTQYGFMENKAGTSGILSLSHNGAAAAISFVGDYSQSDFTPTVNAGGATVFTHP